MLTPRRFDEQGTNVCESVLAIAASARGIVVVGETTLRRAAQFGRKPGLAFIGRPTFVCRTGHARRAISADSRRGGPARSGGRLWHCHQPVDGRAADGGPVCSPR